ncbi:MAG: glutathione S-transferase family protein [Parvibaculum sp.]|uniref:glutathione S-transferase family protein n=1 Tax=Parvibaculum sp. TaxID=2024848 RepID=UPI0025E5A21C|nr:glutathione S-transferase family protein [Parvibaculum sp.]MCE9651149.1 glutathione S-transferase family protein [Parvibaculum sp.]
MVTLYEHPLSPYAQKVKIALREKGIAFDLKMPDAIGTGQTAGEFMSANPRGEVPALVDDGVAIFDSTIILEYIEDKWPSVPMLPKSPADRARTRMLEEVCDTHYEAINWGLGEIGWFRRAEGELAETLRDKAAEQTEKLHAWLERQLGKHDWFNGASFGWGDLSVVPYVAGSANFGNAPDEGSPLGKWFARARARESVATTLRESGASTSAMETVADIVAQGLFKREYRDHRLEWMIRSGGIDVVLAGLEKNNIRFSNDFQ